MTIKISDLDFSRAAGMGERIAAAGHAGYWVKDEAVLALQRGKILDCLHMLASLHGMVLVPADTHATDAALAGIKSVKP